MNAILEMNAIRKAGIAVLLAVAMAPAATFAQNSSDATGTPSATSAPQPHTSKSIRQANRRLASRVRTALTKGKIDARSLTVLAKGGAVTLLGGGQDTAQIQRAGEIAKQVPGVTSVDNRLVQHSDQQ
ncbi:BON domain-containing protein [Burkholderia sp. L27(2015)]|uniref:BON domain-containing protein n=1 Tax=Burkholderia sp. L27(2015) TaxID=1641858 RepID=UPI00131DCAEF|nr:BON domain-containing protein [Burkholderia sp. L27(2015)]